MLALATATLFTTTSCGTKEETPSAVKAYTASNVLMNNQKGTDKQFGKLTTVVGYSTSSDFDIAYGNGSATGNKYFFGGPNDPSIASVYSISGTTQTTYKNVAASVTAATFDSLTNSKAVIAIVDAATPVDNGQGITPTRIKSDTPWSIGTVFAFQTSSGKKAVAKIVAVPSGTTSVSGSVSIDIKFF